VRLGLGNAAPFGCFGFIGRQARWPGGLDWLCGLGGQEQDCSTPPAAATELKARACGPDPVAVVGGANSAAQAALYLAGHSGPDGSGDRSCLLRMRPSRSGIDD
jgi:hypothetical protein